MRKGRRQKIKNGLEYDLNMRQYYNPPGGGGWKWVKKQLNKRFRRDGKQEALKEIEETGPTEPSEAKG